MGRKYFFFFAFPYLNCRVHRKTELTVNFRLNAEPFVEFQMHLGIYI